jgi:hypothetical protein
MKSTEYKVWLERHRLTHEVAGKEAWRAQVDVEALTATERSRFR